MTGDDSKGGSRGQMRVKEVCMSLGIYRYLICNVVLDTIYFNLVELSRHLFLGLHVPNQIYSWHLAALYVRYLQGVPLRSTFHVVFRLQEPKHAHCLLYRNVFVYYSVQ